MKVLRNDFIVTYSSKMLLTVIMTRNYIFLIITNTLFFQAFPVCCITRSTVG